MRRNEDRLKFGAFFYSLGSEFCTLHLDEEDIVPIFLAELALGADFFHVIRFCCLGSDLGLRPRLRNDRGHAMDDFRDGQPAVLEFYGPEYVPGLANQSTADLQALAMISSLQRGRMR